MLKDAQRCVDDLSAICRDAWRQAGHRISGAPVGGAGTDAIRAENVARDVARLLATAHAAGLDVGAAMARLLADAGVSDDAAQPVARDTYHDTPVREFHEVFDHPISYDPSVVPSVKNRVLRIRMIAEELLETAHAMGVHLECRTVDYGAPDVIHAHPVPGAPYDPIEAADGLGDIRYLVDGGNLLCGFPGERVLAEIHRSNMSKLAADGTVIRREDGKILKGPGYFRPDIAGVLGFRQAEAA